MRIKPKIIIQTFKKSDLDAGRTSLALGIHRSTIYRWVKRARTCRGLLNSKVFRKSTKPKTIHFALAPEQISEAVKLREIKGATAEKIVRRLFLPVHPSTLHRLFVRRGLVRKYGYHRRPRFQNTLHMRAENTKTIGCLQMDVKYATPELSGLPYTCFEYAVIDIFSRYKEAVILNHLDQDGSMAALLEILPKLPFKPLFIQTGNGLEFQGRFHQMCEDMNLKHHLIHKIHPMRMLSLKGALELMKKNSSSGLRKLPKTTMN